MVCLWLVLGWLVGGGWWVHTYMALGTVRCLVVFCIFILSRPWLFVGGFSVRLAMVFSASAFEKSGGSSCEVSGIVVVITVTAIVVFFCCCWNGGTCANSHRLS